jgi:GMP synthase-like glutamine amidotransferase
MPVPRVLVFQHAPYCPLESFAELLNRDGITPDIVALNSGGVIPDLEPYHVLIVLGGPMDVWETDANPWLVPEKAAIKHWVKTLDRPMLGVCLGHQLLADALGGEVGYALKPEGGLHDIILNSDGQAHPLMSGFQKSKKAIQFHGCEVTRLPDGGVNLASTENCAIGAFAVGRAAFGIQYHAEATDTLVNEWTDLVPGNALVKKLYGPDGVTIVRKRVADAMPELRANAAMLYHNFMRIARTATADSSYNSG